MNPDPVFGGDAAAPPVPLEHATLLQPALDGTGLQGLVVPLVQVQVLGAGAVYMRAVSDDRGPSLPIRRRAARLTRRSHSRPPPSPARLRSPLHPNVYSGPPSLRRRA